MVLMICPVCQADFPLKNAADRQRRSKSGVICCSRACVNEIQKGVIEVPGSEKIAHRVKDRKSVYRRRALAQKMVCADCGLSFVPMLVVHHIDGNRENGADKNLEVLCFQHHAIRHLRMTANGDWVFSPSFLTPRALLPLLLPKSMPAYSKDIGEWAGYPEDLCKVLA